MKYLQNLSNFSLGTISAQVFFIKKKTGCHGEVLTTIYSTCQFLSQDKNYRALEFKIDVWFQINLRTFFKIY